LTFSDFKPTPESLQGFTCWVLPINLPFLIHLTTS